MSAAVTIRSQGKGTTVIELPQLGKDLHRRDDAIEVTPTRGYNQLFGDHPVIGHFLHNLRLHAAPGTPDTRHDRKWKRKHRVGTVIIQRTEVIVNHGLLSRRMLADLMRRSLIEAARPISV